MENINETKTMNGEATEKQAVLTADTVVDPKTGTETPVKEDNTGWFKRTVNRVKAIGHEVKEHLPLVGASAAIGTALGAGGVILLDRLLGEKSEAAASTDAIDELPAPQVEEAPFEGPEMVPIPTPEEREMNE